MVRLIGADILNGIITLDLAFNPTDEKMISAIRKHLGNQLKNEELDYILKKTEIKGKLV